MNDDMIKRFNKVVATTNKVLFNIYMTTNYYMTTNMVNKEIKQQNQKYIQFKCIGYRTRTIIKW